LQAKLQISNPGTELPQSGKNCLIPLFIAPDAVIIRGQMPLAAFSAINIELFKE
jgi:hypothetical protein